MIFSITCLTQAMFLGYIILHYFVVKIYGNEMYVLMLNHL